MNDEMDLKTEKIVGQMYQAKNVWASRVQILELFIFIFLFVHFPMDVMKHLLLGGGTDYMVDWKKSAKKI